MLKSIVEESGSESGLYFTSLLYIQHSILQLDDLIVATKGASGCLLIIKIVFLRGFEFINTKHYFF